MGILEKLIDKQSLFYVCTGSLVVGLTCGYVYFVELYLKIETIIAILLAFVAYQNYKINRRNFKIQKDKLRLDLFDRRHKIFKSVQELLSAVTTSATIDRTQLYRFIADSSDAEFLFGNEIKHYIDDMRDKTLKLIFFNERLANEKLDIGAERNKLAQQESDLLEWFSQQFIHSRDLFKKYLKFSIDREV